MVLLSLVLSLVTLSPSAASMPSTSQTTSPPAAASRGRAPAGATFDAVAKRANAARDAGRLEEAIGLYREALRLKPDWTEGRWYLGTSYYELDRYSEAATAFKRVVASEPRHGAAWGFRGLCEYQLRQYEPALGSLINARQYGLGPNKELASVVRYHAAVLMTRLGQYELAQKVLTEFVSEANDSPRILEALGLSTLRMPQLPEEVDPTKREAILLAGGGTYYYYSRMTAAANGRFEELLRRYPDLANAHYGFGVVLLNAEPDRAIEEFKRELAQTPTHVPSMLQMAYEYLKRSDWTTAKTWAEQAVKLESDNVPARQALGQALLELDDVTGAIEQLRAGIAIAPETPILHFTLARAYRKAGRVEDAERERRTFQRLERTAPAQDRAVSSPAAPAATPGDPPRSPQ